MKPMLGSLTPGLLEQHRQIRRLKMEEKVLTITTQPDFIPELTAERILDISLKGTVLPSYRNAPLGHQPRQLRRGKVFQRSIPTSLKETQS